MHSDERGGPPVRWSVWWSALKTIRSTAGQQLGERRPRVAGAAPALGGSSATNWACLALFVENRECTRGLEVGPNAVVVSRGHLNRERVAGERLVQDQRDSQRDRLACR